MSAARNICRIDTRIAVIVIIVVIRDVGIGGTVGVHHFGIETREMTFLDELLSNGHWWIEYNVRSD